MIINRFNEGDFTMFHRFASNFLSFFITPKPPIANYNIDAISEHEIYVAAVDGDADQLRSLIAQDGQRANRCNRLHCTPLMCTISAEHSDDAARKNKQYEAFRCLWDCTENKQQVDKAHNNVAFYAAEYGFNEAFDLIISYAQTNDFSLLTQLNTDAKNILMVAIEHNRVDMVERLSKLDANVVKALLEQRDNDDKSIVDYSQGHAKIEKIVINMLETHNLPAPEDRYWQLKRCDSKPRL